MQTTPIATTTSPSGQAKPVINGEGSPAPATAGTFAGLIQALTGGAHARAVPAAGAAGQAAADGEAEAQPAEGGSDAATDAVAQLQGLELQPPLANPMLPVDGAAAAVPGAVSSPPGTGMPAAAAAAPAGASAAAADAPGTESEAVAPPSAQAAELAKVLGAGTQIRVTHAATAPAPAPVQTLAAVAVAAALGEAPAAAVVEPEARVASPEPRNASVVAAGFPVPSDGEHAAATASRPATEPPIRQIAVGADAGADQGVAPPAAVGNAAPSSTVATPSAGTDGTGETPSAEPAPVAFGRESQPGQSQAPAPAAPTPERAQAPAFAAAPPANQVSVHFAKAVRAGVDRIEIQLAPASLGRVDISLDLGDAQQVRASISVETKEALELLRADARVLERALQDAGLKTDPGSLSFQLRDQGARAGQDGGARQGFAGHPGNGRDSEQAQVSETAATSAAQPAPYGSGRVDIHA